LTRLFCRRCRRIGGNGLGGGAAQDNQTRTKSNDRSSHPFGARLIHLIMSLHFGRRIFIHERPSPLDFVLRKMRLKRNFQNTQIFHILKTISSHLFLIEKSLLPEMASVKTLARFFAMKP
jgi:hypothetical protein